MIAGSIDANVVLRIILNDLPTQRQAAINLLSQHAPSRFRLDTIAVAEVVFVLGRNYGMARSDIAVVMGNFLKHPQILSELAVLELAFSHFAAYPTLSFEDCVLAARARQIKALPLYTFDKKLARQTEEAVLVGAMHEVSKSASGRQVKTSRANRKKQADQENDSCENMPAAVG